MTLSSSLRHHGRVTALLTGVLVVLALLWPGAAHAADGSSTSVPPGKAWVRVGHFVPGMGATIIQIQPVDGSAAPMTLASSATYGQVTAYQKLTPGSYHVTVRSTTATSGSAPMLARSFEIGASDARTVAVLGTADAPRLAVLSDDLTPPTAGTARVRLLSASQTADSVTVAAVGGPTIAKDAVLGQATAYATVPAGSWTLQLQSDMASATLQSVPITSGSVYTVVVLDAGDQKVQLDVVTDAAGAMTAPKGGAKTGLGGMAPGRSATTTPGHGLAGGAPDWELGLGAVLLSAGTALSLLRRRHRIAVRTST